MKSYTLYFVVKVYAKNVDAWDVKMEQDAQVQLYKVGAI